MNIFGKKLAAHGIYNVRHRDRGPKESHYDGVMLLSNNNNMNA
jgi:hypothetical protein